VADDRWLERASAANAHAAMLARALTALPGVALVAPVQVNLLFLRLPAAAVAALDRGPFDFYKLGRDLRFVCRHDQEPAGIEAMLDCVRVALTSRAAEAGR